MPETDVLSGAQLVEVVDSDMVMGARGAMVTPEDAYRTYIAMGARSLRRTADLLGVPIGTMHSWNRRYQWQSRVRLSDIEATEGLAQMAAVVAVAQGVKSLEALAKVRDTSEDDRARVEASKELLRQFNGITAVIAGSALVKNHDADDELDYEEMASTPDGARKLLELARDRTGT